jgi:hypothetical protein
LRERRLPVLPVHVVAARRRRAHAAAAVCVTAEGLATSPAAAAAAAAAAVCTVLLVRRLACCVSRGHSPSRLRRALHSVAALPPPTCARELWWQLVCIRGAWCRAE